MGQIQKLKFLVLVLNFICLRGIIFVRVFGPLMPPLGRLLPNQAAWYARTKRNSREAHLTKRYRTHRDMRPIYLPSLPLVDSPKILPIRELRTAASRIPRPLVQTACPEANAQARGDESLPGSCCGHFEGTTSRSRRFQPRHGDSCYFFSLPRKLDAARKSSSCRHASMHAFVSSRALHPIASHPRLWQQPDSPPAFSFSEEPQHLPVVLLHDSVRRDHHLFLSANSIPLHDGLALRAEHGEVSKLPSSSCGSTH